MIEPAREGEAARAHGRRNRWRRARRRAVSPIVATILLLSITVILFAGVFFLVQAFPKPASQSLGQFAASVAYGPCGAGTYVSQICAISILHGYGPAVAGTSTAQLAVYVTSQNRTSLFTGPFTIAQGGLAGATWGFGQTWRLSTASGYNLYAPDNLTVSVVASGQLLFRAVVPASVTHADPLITESSILPSTLAGASASFNVTVLVENSSIDPISSMKATANLCELQNSPCAHVAMSYAKKTGLFYATGTTSLDPSTGTYFVFVTVTGAGGSSSVLIPVAFTH